MERFEDGNSFVIFPDNSEIGTIVRKLAETLDGELNTSIGYCTNSLNHQEGFVTLTFIDIQNWVSFGKIIEISELKEYCSDRDKNSLFIRYLIRLYFTAKEERHEVILRSFDPKSPVYTYDNVLLERIDSHFMPESAILPIFIDHDSRHDVGKCFNITRSEKGLFGTLATTKDISGLYPSLGYVVTGTNPDRKSSGKIINVGVCANPNLDPEIPALASHTQP